MALKGPSAKRSGFSPTHRRYCSSYTSLLGTLSFFPIKVAYFSVGSLLVTSRCAIRGLDEQRQWYRYHDLFREALRTQLHASQPELVPLLHRRAARWYETQGEWREAITHALAAPDYPLAASLMEQAAPHFWLSGEARTVHTWVLALPDPVLRVHTSLALDAALRFLNSVHISIETVHASMAAQVQRTITRMEAILHGQEAHLLSEAEVALIERRVCL